MKIRLMAGALALVFAGAQPAAAEFYTSPYGSLTATAGIVSQYRFRGISQSDEHPTVQGSLEWAHQNGFYAGLWGSGVDFTDANMELDLYGGYRGDVSGVRYNFALLRYFYPGARDNLDYDFWEGKASTGYDFGLVDLSAALNYSPNFFRGSNDAIYASLKGTAPIGQTGFYLLGSFGHQSVDKNATFGRPDYTDWTMGAGYNWNGFDFTGKYVDTDIKKANCLSGDCDATGVLAVSKTF